LWDNADWANRHIQKKRKGTAQEAWEVVFEGDPLPLPMRSPEQLNFPPYIRYWTMGETKKGKLLFVVWEKHRETMNLITAFEPDHQRIDLYEKLKKKAKKR
jgi:hypothetical protein